MAEWLRWLISLSPLTIRSSFEPAVTGVGSSPTRVTSETSQVLLAGVSEWFRFPGYLGPIFKPHLLTLARLDMSEIIVERDV